MQWDKVQVLVVYSIWINTDLPNSSTLLFYSCFGKKGRVIKYDSFKFRISSHCWILWNTFITWAKPMSVRPTWCSMELASILQHQLTKHFHWVSEILLNSLSQYPAVFIRLLINCKEQKCCRSQSLFFILPILSSTHLFFLYLVSSFFCYLLNPLLLQ